MLTMASSFLQPWLLRGSSLQWTTAFFFIRESSILDSLNSAIIDDSSDEEDILKEEVNKQQ